jgi:hypothetical protein
LDTIHLRTSAVSLAALAGVLSSACVPTAEDNFTDGRSQVACTSTVPVCSTTAGCVLDGTNYAAGNFAQGATQRVIVRTTVPSEIDVSLFFVTESSPGTDTEVTWYEVGCTDRFSVDSNGVDVFASAGPDRVWLSKQQVFTDGDHLVEVFSDAQADYLLKVDVKPTQ